MIKYGAGLIKFPGGEAATVPRSWLPCTVASCERKALLVPRNQGHWLDFGYPTLTPFYNLVSSFYPVHLPLPVPTLSS